MYGVSPTINQEEMNTRGEENEGLFHKLSSNFRNFRNYIGTFVTNQYLTIKNRKSNPILKLKDGNVCKFQEKSKKEKIIKKLNEIIQILKYEGTNSENY